MSRIVRHRRRRSASSASALLTARMFGPGAQRAPFRSGVDVIGMNVTVTDASRHYVTDLDRQDFQIFEDGRPQEVTFFRKGSLPLALALLIDTSASMEQNLDVAQEAAVGFVRALAPADVASVIDFDSRVQVRQDFTADRNALEHAIRQTSAGGSTALYNAVYIALKELNKTIRDEPLAESRRRAIVILSDGEDTSSLVGFDEVLDLAARSDTAIYAIGLLGREIAGYQATERSAVRVAKAIGADGRPCVLCVRRKRTERRLWRDQSGAVESVLPRLRIEQRSTRRPVSPHRRSCEPCERGGSSATRLLRAQPVGSRRSRKPDRMA